MKPQNGCELLDNWRVERRTRKNSRQEEKLLWRLWLERIDFMFVKL